MHPLKASVVQPGFCPPPVTPWLTARRRKVCGIRVIPSDTCSFNLALKVLDNAIHFDGLLNGRHREILQLIVGKPLGRGRQQLLRLHLILIEIDIR
jgi:hypothetical protein